MLFLSPGHAGQAYLAGSRAVRVEEPRVRDYICADSLLEVGTILRLLILRQLMVNYLLISILLANRPREDNK